MRIAGWHIEGFGIFHDFEVQLPPGLSVFLGPNEAGKSTLLGFLRAMLFGFPTRRAKAPQYPPLNGGRHGGRLILAGLPEEIVVERFAGRRNGLVLNGREVSQEELHPLLGGADERLFSSVFAFGLSEIQSFAWLEAEQVRERIFSAGVSGAGASARRVIEELDNQAAAILRPRGASRIKSLTEQIDEAQKRLEAAQREAERYTALEDEEESARKQAALLAEEEAGLLEQQRAFEARIASTEAALRTVGRIEEEIAAKEKTRAELQSDERLESIADRVEEMHGQLTQYLSRFQALGVLREKKGLNPIWLALGAALTGTEIWLAGRNEIAAWLAAIIVTLAGTAFLLQERAARWARVEALEQAIAQWQDPVREWLNSPSSGERLTQEFLSLRELCRSNREVRAQVPLLDQAIAEIKTRLESVKQGLAPPEPDKAGRDEAERIRESLRDVRRRRDEAVGAQRLAENARRRIGESAAVPAVQAEIECLSAELAEAIREWRVLTLAGELVGATLEEYTATRQPAVLEEASAAFGRVTAGAYQRVLQDEERENLVVIDSQGQRKRLEELSRGTAEQLYLCVRLGLASEFARRSAPLPLVMDDVLVNFDPERASAVAQELVRFSNGRQVLIFTCHPETARLFSEAKPDLIVIRLPRQRESAAKH